MPQLRRSETIDVQTAVYRDNMDSKIYIVILFITEPEEKNEKIEREEEKYTAINAI
jgi:hypothetical protein